MCVCHLYIYIYINLYTSQCGFVYSLANPFQTAVIVLFPEHCFQENLRHIDCCSDSPTSSYFKLDIPFWALITPIRIWISLIIPSSPDLADDDDGSLCRKPFVLLAKTMVSTGLRHLFTKNHPLIIGRAPLAVVARLFRGLRLLLKACHAFLPTLAWSMVLLGVIMSMSDLT